MVVWYFFNIFLPKVCCVAPIAMIEYCHAKTRHNKMQAVERKKSFLTRSDPPGVLWHQEAPGSASLQLAREALMSQEMVEVVIDSIRVSLMSQQRIVILREVDADRYLAIWIGPYEAEAITIALQEVEVARPLTHDLLRNVFRAFDAKLMRVEVLSLREDVFYGNIVAESNGYTLDIDSRPSDALALAVRANVPILVSREVMENAGIIPEEDLETQPEETPALAEPEPESEGSAERLSVFEDFLEKLDTTEGEGGGEGETPDADDEPQDDS
jgi:bifunctional DNase/RNase